MEWVHCLNCFYTISLELNLLPSSDGVVVITMTVYYDYYYYYYYYYWYPVRSSCSPIGRLPRWRIGECSPDMVGTGEIKYPGRTKLASAALQEDIELSKARGRKPRWQITWSSRLRVRRWASNPSLVKQIQKLKILPK